MYPERVAALVLSGTWARFYATEGYPWGRPAGEREDRPRMTAVCLGERILSPPPDRDDNGCITDLP